MKILLCGASGKMGTIVAETAAEAGETVVAGVDLFPRPAAFPVYTSFDEVVEEADVLIDFSAAEGIRWRLAYAARHALPCVLAATGYSAEEEQCVKSYAAHVPIFKTGNLSVGINLLEMLVKKAAAVLTDFDAEIIERHHNLKKDAPSGTALMLAECIRSASEEKKTAVFGRHGPVGARKAEEIGIHSVRGGNLVGEHEVMFAGEDEVITLSHSARSRKVFAKGALRAARWMLGRSAGLYDMDDLLGDVLG